MVGNAKTLGGEAQDFVLGDVLRPLVVAVEVREVGDVNLVRRSAGLRVPQAQRRDRGREHDPFDPLTGRGAYDVATALDVDFVEA